MAKINNKTTLINALYIGRCTHIPRVTQEDVANQLNMSYSTVLRGETEGAINVNNLCKLLDFYELKIVIKDKYNNVISK